MSDKFKARHISWDWLERHLKSFAEDHGPAKLWTGLVPVARGGLVPATVLSHLMDIPIVGVIQASSYGKDKTPGPVRIAFPDWIPTPHEYRNLLIVEDIIDSGATLDAIAKHPRFGNCSVLAFIDKRKRPYSQDVMSCNSMRPGDADVWITFPWEISAG